MLYIKKIRVGREGKTLQLTTEYVYAGDRASSSYSACTMIVLCTLCATHDPLYLALHLTTIMLLNRKWPHLMLTAFKRMPLNAIYIVIRRFLMIL